LPPSPPFGAGIGSAFWVEPQQLLPQLSQHELQQSQHLLRLNRALSLSRQLSLQQESQQLLQLDWQHVVGQQVVWQQVVGQQLVQHESQQQSFLWNLAFSLSRKLSFSQQQSQQLLQQELEQLDWQQLVVQHLGWQQDVVQQVVGQQLVQHLGWQQVVWQQLDWQQVVGQQLEQQESQQLSFFLNLFINFCRQPSFSQQLSQQVLQHEPQPPQHELAATGAGAAAAAEGASAPISQAVVTNKNAAFTSDPPFESSRGARPRRPGRGNPVTASSLRVVELFELSPQPASRAPTREGRGSLKLLYSFGCQAHLP
jgi:hypothetical protein